MKNLNILFILTFTLVFFSCEKKELVNQSEVDEKIIIEYLESNNYEAVKHSKGMYITFIQEGYGSSPRSNSVVEVQYKGYLTDGTVFDQTTGGNTATLSLSTLIEGWKIGLPYIKEGGKARFYIPSKLGYGSNAVGEIPKNSVLIFDIYLIDVK